MTYEELLAKIDWYDPYYCEELQKALLAIMELHKPQFNPPGCEDETCCPAFVSCEDCGAYYPCSTIQAIEKELG